MNYQKKSINVSYTKAKIKPFLNPLFWCSSIVVVLFFYSLWQYTQNPNIFSRETGRPAQDGTVANNTGEVTDANTPGITANQNPLNDDELSALADIDNISNLIQERQAGEANSGKNPDDEKIDLATEIATNLTDFNDLKSSFQEIVLSPLVNPGQESEKDSNNKSQNELFQQFLKPDNLLGNNSIISSRNQGNVEKIEVIRPQVQLPTLQDLTQRQRSAVEEYNAQQYLQSIQNPSGQPNSLMNNTPNGVTIMNQTRNPEPLPTRNPNNPVINTNSVPNLNRQPNIPIVQGNNNFSPYSPINPQINPQVNPQVNPQFNPQIPSGLGQNNINNNLGNGLNNNNFNNNVMPVSPPTQNQEPVRNQSGFLYYY